ncbi:hypothetical protein BN946_scf185040.g2 [Trametes cinnabarina]|uniref:Uncharacterized protein n=1 Tax=Pycnoporus cinnabarinus TaxID=5643 RepID=A0A060SAT5_PYCCI|nr:hypothetical protein BN946_scf185040.g2 [Trametes cinnabarina]
MARATAFSINTIKIPCSSPPLRDQFIARVALVPTGNSKADQQARIIAVLVTLQNINGPDVGCPAVSTVYGQLQQQINALPN